MTGREIWVGLCKSASVGQQALEAPAGGLDPTGAGYLRGGAGCVTTAAWWCQKQPPRPMAAAMVMAKAIKMRIVFPSFC